MALVKPFILQIVGFQNSGKTTLMAELIKRLSTFDIRTVTIKHHGHGGRPQGIERKDTGRHLAAGAAVSLVEGNGCFVLQGNDIAFKLENQMELMGFFDPDVILIEGYKQENYPKLVLLRDHHDLHLLDQVTNVIGILFWEQQLKERISIAASPEVKIFSICDEKVFDWLIKYYIQNTKIK